ncbi:hypothetical protein [Caedibacter taeniospiralis]|uniref:hypothetical protein n=1 Tax=Caedibacter taeniospiralis TaxID=28907 RepID=UPI000C275FAD|nr:hypothetical protein [Caedibacter taeniospiralis]
MKPAGITDLLNNDQSIRKKLYYKDTGFNATEFPYKNWLYNTGEVAIINPKEFAEGKYPWSSLQDMAKQYFAEAYEPLRRELRYLYDDESELQAETKRRMENALKAYKNLYVSFALEEDGEEYTFTEQIAPDNIDQIYAEFMDSKKLGNHLPQCLLEQVKKNKADKRLKHNQESIDIFPIEIYTTKTGMFSVTYDSSQEGNFYGWGLNILPRLIYENQNVTAIEYNSKYYEVTSEKHDDISSTYSTEQKAFTFDRGQHPVKVEDNFNGITIEFSYAKSSLTTICIRSLSESEKILMDITLEYFPTDNKVIIKKNDQKMATVLIDQVNQEKLIQSVTNPVSETTKFTYNPFNKLSSISYPSGLQKEFQYFDEYNDILKSTSLIDRMLGIQKFISDIFYVNLSTEKNKCEIKRVNSIRNAQGDELTNVVQFAIDNAMTKVGTRLSNLYKTISAYAIDYAASSISVNFQGHSDTVTFSQLQQILGIKFNFDNIANKKLSADFSSGKSMQMTTEDKTTTLQEGLNRYAYHYGNYGLLDSIHAENYFQNIKLPYFNHQALTYKYDFRDKALTAKVYGDDDKYFESKLVFNSYSDFTLYDRNNQTVKFKLDESRRPVSIDDSAQTLLSYDYFSFEKNGFNAVTIDQGGDITSYFLDVFNIPYGDVFSVHPQALLANQPEAIYEQSSRVSSKLNDQIINLKDSDFYETIQSAVKELIVPAISSSVIYLAYTKDAYSSQLDNNGLIERRVMLNALILSIITTTSLNAIVDYFSEAKEEPLTDKIIKPSIELGGRMFSSIFQYLEMTSAVDHKSIQAILSGVMEHILWEFSNQLHHHSHSEWSNKLMGTLLNGAIHGFIDGGGAYLCEKYIPEENYGHEICGFVRGMVSELARLAFQQYLSPAIFGYKIEKQLSSYDIAHILCGAAATGIVAAGSHHFYDRVSASDRTPSDFNRAIASSIVFAYPLPALLPYS